MPAEVRPRDDEDGQEAGQPVAKISCIECRRLKRKCDRVHPCNQCKRYDKNCVFPEPEAPRRGKKYVAEMQDRLEKLESLLHQHAPHVNLDESEGHDASPRDTKPVTPLDNFFRPPSHSPALPHRPVQPSFINSSSPSSTRSVFDHHSATTPSALRPPLPPPGPVAVTASTADAYERQPRNASGYEWNERVAKAIKENDGTASLSVEPDGEGYLGFAAGATLLRILQITAGGISLANLPTHISDGPAPDHWMPSHQQVCAYIDSYFQHYHPQYPIVHEATFRAQHAQVIAQPPRIEWELLLNTVVSLGAFCCSQPMYVVDYFLERAVSVITADHLETGSLVLVQAFTLLSNISQKRNKSNSGSTYLGIAVRMAIGLGLHRELPLWDIKPFEREVRRRVWWVLFIFDAGASITFGRPILLPYGEADVKMVHNVQDRDFTPTSPAVPPASRETTVYSSLIYQASLVIVSNRCYGRVISTPPPSAEEVLELDHDLTDWHASVPDWMTAATRHDTFQDTSWLYFSSHKLFWRYCNLRIILHRRAFLERALKRLPLCAEGSPRDTDLELMLSSICLQSATDTIYDIHEFFNGRSPTALEKWYGLHFIFQASFVPLIALHTDPSSPARGRWQECVRLARETLQRVEGDPLAARCLRIIDLLTPTVQDMSSEVNTLLEMLQTNPMWQGQGDVAQDLLPFADLATLMSFWPSGTS